MILPYDFCSVKMNIKYPAQMATLEVQQRCTRSRLKVWRINLLVHSHELIQLQAILSYRMSHTRIL